MRPRRRRNLGIVAGSAVFHLGVLALVALHAPQLTIDEEDAGPPQPIIPVLLVPRLPPPPPGSSAPAQIRLHRRPLRYTTEPLPIDPLPIPPEPAVRTEPAPQQREPPQQATPPALPPQVRNALKLGPLGCDRADFLSLSRAEREACEDRLAAGARDAPYLPPGKTAARRAELQAEGARKDALVRRKEAPLAPGIRMPTPQDADYDGEPYITGAGESAVGQAEYKPSKRAARKLERLKP
jgi:hypothetical protein